MKRLAIILSLLTSGIVADAQSRYFGTWNVANGQYYFNSKTNVWAETQLRSQRFFNDLYYHELKAGVSYQINKSFGLLMGVGQYATYSNGGNFKSPVLNHEFRLWEQFTLVNNISIVKLEHRYRIEQRWRSDGYRNRFRYRINPIIPINKSKVQPHTLFLTLFDEIFLTDQPAYFERNRFFAGIGYQFTKVLTVQSGYISQFDYSLTNASAKGFLQTTLFVKFNNHKAPVETHPANVD